MLWHDANTEAKDDKGNTPIILAAKNKKWEAVTVLIDHRANINAYEDKGDTALH